MAGAPLSWAFAAAVGIVVSVTTPVQNEHEAAAAIVEKIQRADYEGDRAALEQLRGELAKFVDNLQLSSRVLYWRGFALWRRAFNAGTDPAARKEIDDDLTQAAADFREAAARDPAFADAKGAEASCLVNIAAMNMGSERARNVFPRSEALLKDALSAAPDNPRLLWILGANQFYRPPEFGGGQALGLATYERGLELVRRQKGRGGDRLEPSWGEPELLMALAVSNLNRTTPDVAAAERYAERALALVPYWHYVRDILMSQIRRAKERG